LALLQNLVKGQCKSNAYTIQQLLAFVNRILQTLRIFTAIRSQPYQYQYRKRGQIPVFLFLPPQRTQREFYNFSLSPVISVVNKKDFHAV